jgi:hypothetical protein
MEANFIYFTSWTMQACFPGYAHVSWAIWLDFTKETKKHFKLQEDKLILKIWSLHDESHIETIKIDVWKWFGARSRKLWHFENPSGCKTGGSGLGKRRVQFSWIKPESESRFLPYLVRILRFVKMAMSSCLYICRSRPIVRSFRPNQSINQSFFYFFEG